MIFCFMKLKGASFSFPASLTSVLALEILERADTENLKQVQATLNQNSNAIQTVYQNSDTLPSHGGRTQERGVTRQLHTWWTLELTHSLWLASGDLLFPLQMQKSFSNEREICFRWEAWFTLWECDATGRVPWGPVARLHYCVFPQFSFIWFVTFSFKLEFWILKCSLLKNTMNIFQNLGLQYAFFFGILIPCLFAQLLKRRIDINLSSSMEWITWEDPWKHVKLKLVTNKCRLWSHLDFSHKIMRL